MQGAQEGRLWSVWYQLPSSLHHRWSYALDWQHLTSKLLKLDVTNLRVLVCSGSIITLKLPLCYHRRWPDSKCTLFTLSCNFAQQPLMPCISCRTFNELPSVQFESVPWLDVSAGTTHAAMGPWRKEQDLCSPFAETLPWTSKPQQSEHSKLVLRNHFKLNC